MATGMIWPQPFMVEAHLSQCPGWRTLDLHFDNDVRQTNPEYTVQLPDGGAGSQTYYSNLPLALTGKRCFDSCIHSSWRTFPPATRHDCDVFVYKFRRVTDYRGSLRQCAIPRR